jgi:transglutaminase/protease-like cytokinesis protein 3
MLTSSSDVLDSSTFKKSSDNAVKKSFDISGIDDGSYDVRIYTSDTQYGKYKSYVYNLITLVKSDGDIYFQIPTEVYQINKDFIEKNYRSNDYYLHQNFPNDSTSWVYTNDTVKEIAEEITAGCTTDYEKIKAVHDWAADNIYYDYDYYTNRTTSTMLTPEDVYENKYSVCQGYADFCASLLRSLDIPCKVASGYAQSKANAWTDYLINGSSTNHAWNEAWLADEQRWVIFDATWDSSNTKNKIDGEGLVTAARKDTYFDITPYVFAGNHKVVKYSQQLYTSLGNVNLDSKVDNADVAAFLKHFSGAAPLSDTALKAKYADVDGNLKIDFADVIATLKKIAFNKYV